MSKVKTFYQMVEDLKVFITEEIRELKDIIDVSTDSKEKARAMIDRLTLIDILEKVEAL